MLLLIRIVWELHSVCEVLVLRLVWLGIRIIRRVLASLALYLLCVGSFWRCLRDIVRGVKSWLTK